MKKRSFWFFLIAGVVCAALALMTYFFGGVTEELTDAISYRQSGNGGKITNETQISQSFFCKYNDIKNLMLRSSLLGSTHEKGVAVFTLSDEKENQLARQEISLADLKDKGAVTFSFGETLKNTGGKVLTLTAGAKDMEEEKCYSLMIGQGSVGGVLTTAEGKTSEKNSLFMTITYLNPVLADNFAYFLMVLAVMFFSFLPMTFSRKGGRQK